MTPLPPPPRLVRATHAKPVLIAVVYLLLAAALAGTLFFVGVIANELALRWLGHDVDATVSRIHEQPNRSGTYDRIAHYAYSLPGGAPRADRSELAWAAFRRLSMPFLSPAGGYEDITFPADARPTLGVRAYAIGPVAYSRAVEHDWGKFYLPVAGLFVAAGGLLSFALYLAGVVRPRRHRRLYTHGVAVPGTVTGRYVTHSKHGSLYYVQYTFTPAGADAPVAATAMVPDQAAHDAAAPGQEVTVLHEPADPRRSTIYEYCGFRCA